MQNQIKNFQVCTSCSSRYHIFDQARQLQKYGVLQKLIHSTHPFLPRRWQIPMEKCEWLTKACILGQVEQRLFSKLSIKFNELARRYVHSVISRQIALRLPDNC